MAIKFDYVLLEACGKKELDDAVRCRLNRGYKLVGGGSASSHQSENDPTKFEVGYLQAVVREYIE